MDTLVKCFIREKYGFIPTLEFEDRNIKDDLLMPWQQLSDSIPGGINKQIERIRRYADIGEW